MRLYHSYTEGYPTDTALCVLWKKHKNGFTSITNRCQRAAVKLSTSFVCSSSGFSLTVSITCSSCTLQPHLTAPLTPKFTMFWWDNVLSQLNEGPPKPMVTWFVQNPPGRRQKLWLSLLSEPSDKQGSRENQSSTDCISLAQYPQAGCAPTFPLSLWCTRVDLSIRNALPRSHTEGSSPGFDSAPHF